MAFLGERSRPRIPKTTVLTLHLNSRTAYARSPPFHRLHPVVAKTPTSMAFLGERSRPRIPKTTALTLHLDSRTAYARSLPLRRLRPDFRAKQSSAHHLPNATLAALLTCLRTPYHRRRWPYRLRSIHLVLHPRRREKMSKCF